MVFQPHGDPSALNTPDVYVTRLLDMGREYKPACTIAIKLHVCHVHSHGLGRTCSQLTDYWWKIHSHPLTAFLELEAICVNRDIITA